MKYIVRLKPLSPFFFGGETTFGDNENSDYFVKSETMPQAASIIGVMRYMLLKVHGLLMTGDKAIDSENAEARKNLIGEKSFSIDGENAFGALKSVSPVFVEKGGSLTLMPCVADMGYSLQFSQHLSFMGNRGGKKALPIVHRMSDNALFPYKDYDNWQFWIDNEGKRHPYDEIFIDYEQIGIAKNEMAKDSKAFFKQTLKQFASPDFCFVFSAEIDDDKMLEFAKSHVADTVQLGGNRSIFEISITMASDSDPEPLDRFTDSVFLSSKEDANNPARIVLMSDTYLPQDCWDNLDFVWGTSLANRYVNSSVEKYRGGGKPEKTSLFRLMSRGSVVYHHNFEEALNILKRTNIVNSGLNAIITQ